MVRHLIVDLETDSLDTNKANIKIFGAYDIEDEKYFIIAYDESKKEKINDILKSYDWIITFNGDDYDIPILERHKIKLPNKWNHIDLFKIIKFKRNTMLIKDGFQRFSLKHIIERLRLDDEGTKGDIDYKIFQKDKWTEEEINEIIKYTKQDLLLTTKLWLYMVNRFESFADFIPQKDVERYKHITTASGSYSYKAICHMTGLPEYYNDIMDFGEEFEGAYVSQPSVESARGVILCFDFASLYPWMDIMGNLFSHSCECCSQDEKWHGGDFFKVEGYYCSKQLGVVEECIKKLYCLRKEYKKNKDKREQAVKILINSIYGISGSPRFTSLYNINTAGDCTGLGRQCIKYARKIFKNAGFEVLYSDTDSVYVKVENKEAAINCAKEISRFLSSKFNFPHPEFFDLKLDEEIRYIQFFGKKKHYLYVTNDGRLVVKGLQIIKRDTTALSRKIFDDIKQLIIENNECKFDKFLIIDMIRKYLRQDISLAAKRFSIRSSDSYKSKTSIQYTILQELGEGNHLLIKNNLLGIGKGVKYCTIEQAKNLDLSQINMDIFLSELEPFIKISGGNKWF